MTSVRGERFEAITWELYSLSPAEFIAARDAKVAEAKKAGEGELAAELKRLRRPSVGAFLTNQLARDRPEELRRLVKLGEELRSAQERFDGEALRQLSRERVKHLQSLESEARRLAQHFAFEMSAAASEEVRSTLEAALVDAEAADLLTSGRLQSGLHYSGLGPAGASSEHAKAPAPARPAKAPAPARPAKAPAPARPAKAARQPAGTDPRSSGRQVALAQARPSEESRAAAREAEKLARRLAEAERQLARAGEEVARARTLLDRKRAKEAELRNEISQLAKDARAAERAARGRRTSKPAT